MGYLADGFAWGFRPGFFKAIRGFERRLGATNGNMQLACRELLQDLDYEVKLTRCWRLTSGSILFVSDHHSVLDGFAIPLVCPQHLKVRRVVFLLSALLVGRQFARHSISIWPRGNYRNLLYQTHGFIDRIAYLITHRWGPWVRLSRALNEMTDTLKKGECLVLLPSGTIGELQWRRGVGALIQALADQQSCYLAPVYLKWDDAQRRLEMDAPKLIHFAAILQAPGAPSDSQELANWLAHKYRQRDWDGLQ
jgi:hypothetical protein